MSANDNTIGVRAELDTKQFEASSKRLDAMINDLNKEVDQFEKNQIKSAKERAAAEEKASRQSQAALKQQGNSLGAARRDFLNFAAQVTAAVAAVTVVYKKLEDAAQLRGMIVAAQNLSASYGVSFESILKGLDEVAKGTLSLEERVLIANRAMIAGGADFADKIPELYKIARAAATATGQDVGFVFETLTRGIAKASPLLIDNAEIYLKVGNAIDQYAEKLGKSKEELTAHERQQAVLNAILKDGAGLVARVGEGASDQTKGFNQLNASLKDLVATLGLAANEFGQVSGAMSTASDIARGLQDILAKAAGGGALISTLLGGGTYSEAYRKSRQVYQRSLGNMPSGEDDRREVIQSARQSVSAYSVADEERLAKLDEFRKKAADIQEKVGEDILEAQKDWQRSSIDAWNDYQQKLADIEINGSRKRRDLAVDLSDKIADAETDYQRQSEKNTYEHDKKLADIERDYQEKIYQIQREYDETASEAIAARDALALLRAMRKRDKDMEAAARDRDRNRADEESDYARRQEEQRAALEQQRQDARIAYERALRDLQQSLQDQRADADLHYQRTRQQQADAFNQKIADLQTQYNQEYAEKQAEYMGLEAQYQAHLEQMRALMEAYGFAHTGTGGSEGTSRKRAKGGLDIVSSPTNFTAGEAGAEAVLTVPLSGGRMLPAPSVQTVNHTGDFSHSIDAAIRSQTDGMDGRILAAVRQALGEVLG